ncbi:GIY-YIG nuclease family protein [Aliarcobacter cryaerophilus]|uniref:GIY-YIG nuclease family protein n=1 Tax=Aliarcobacter cryaerophilus TaxID=28198 RepID=UPI00112F5371|nr:GIY-YIG nuclease family protein [Aliarcobacter cryaerophilus]
MNQKNILNEEMLNKRNTEKEKNRVGYKISKLEDRIDNLIKRNEYLKNIRRLKKRIDVKIGGDTRLYYFKFTHNGQKYFKIGITKNSVLERYSKSDGFISYATIEINKIFFDIQIENAKKIEQIIIKGFKDFLCNDSSILYKENGYTEVFKKDVLNLDTYEYEEEKNMFYITNKYLR